MIQCNQNISFDLLLEGLFDYAGMFPPASRSFAEAIRESGSFSKTLQRPWMVSADFVLDTPHAERLPREDLIAAGFQRDVSVCLLVSDSPSNAVAAAQALRLAGKGGIGFRVASLEAKAKPSDLDSILTMLGPCAESLGCIIAIEPDLSTTSWRKTLSLTIDKLLNARMFRALKCRATGDTAIGPDRLSAAIATACDAGLSFKVTGGFHHPIVEPARHEYPMGFLNLAAAVMFRRSLGSVASESLLAELLMNRSRSELTCLEGLRYKSLHITHQQLTEAKGRAHFSIGSCSLHEPDADLIRLFA